MESGNNTGMSPGIGKFLQSLQERGVHIRLVGSQLHYRAPENVCSPDVIEEIRARKSEIINWLSKAHPQLQPRQDIQCLSDVTRDGPIPATGQQQAFWLLNELYPGSSAYNICAAFRCDGILATARLRACLVHLVGRHDVLRSGLRLAEEKLIQIISEQVTIHMPYVDLRNLPESLQSSEIRNCTDLYGRAGFDLSVPPCWRIALLRVSERQHILLVTMHHAIFDAWSLRLLMDELAALYNGGLHNKSNSIPKRRIQYSDYAYWQQAALTAGLFEASRAYWLQSLRDAPHFLDLRMGAAIDSACTNAAGVVRLDLPQALVEKFVDLQRKLSITRFNLFLAAYIVTLHRYSQQTDLVIGVPFANRSQEGTESILGCMANVLPLRFRCGGQLMMCDVLNQVRDTVSAAQDREDIPLALWAPELKHERASGRNPIFQVLYAYHERTGPALCLNELAIEELEVPISAPKVDMTLNVIDNGSKVSVLLEYDQGICQPSIMPTFVEHFRRILSETVRDVTQLVAKIPLLLEKDRNQLEVYSDGIECDYPLAKSVQCLFEKQAMETPDSIALVYSSQQLSYHALNLRANRLARHLLAIGLGAESPVGVCMQRSSDMVIAILGILKAGAVYVPLDPSHPPGRLRVMVQDAGMKVVVAQIETKSLLPVDGLKTVIVGQDDDDAEKIDIDTSGLSRYPTQLAYILYTSGSTGRPKGVGVAQNSLCNGLHWMLEQYSITACDRILHKTPISFDVSLWELFGPLIAGARLIITTPDLHRDTNYLSNIIGAQCITIVHFVPAMLGVFVEHKGWKFPASVRHVLCSGEALPVSLVASRPPTTHHQLHNLYGPTEAAVHVTSWTSSASPTVSGSVPIGVPIANLHVYILDNNMEMMPPGVAGELYIGGINLARGYCGRPALTAQNFVPDPYSNIPGARLYRTGDLVRFSADGNIEFIGRVDSQIKLRGVRIELSEIEAVLERQKEVKTAVVLKRESIREGAYLAAYVTLRESSVDVLTLRSYLARELPAIMIPSSFTFLDAMPLTVNGKIDRNALPESDIKVATERVVRPETLLEKHIAEIWMSILGVQAISCTEGFFSLGGNSLSMIRMLVKLREEIDQDITLLDIFAHPTIRALAVYIDSRITILSRAPDHNAQRAGLRAYGLNLLRERMVRVRQEHER